MIRSSSDPCRVGLALVYTATQRMKSITNLPKLTRLDKKPPQTTIRIWKHLTIHIPHLKSSMDKMESDNLRTASLYINNQLLSRGLLRNGQTIDFACPDKGEGGMEATMGRVMSVVNDLILRRDVSSHATFHSTKY